MTAEIGHSATFERLAAALQPGGRFAWNAFAFDHCVAAHLDGVHQDSSLWWATKNEWLGLIDVAGLGLEALYGGFAGEPFTDDSTEYVFVARL